MSSKTHQTFSQSGIAGNTTLDFSDVECSSEESPCHAFRLWNLLSKNQLLIGFCDVAIAFTN